MIDVVDTLLATLYVTVDDFCRSPRVPGESAERGRPRSVS